MKRKTVKIIVDILMFAAMCFLCGTGLLIHYRLIPGYRGGHGLSLLGLTRHAWGGYHLYSAYLLMFLVIVHLALNFTFIKNTIARNSTWLMTALCLVGLFIILFFLLMPVQRNGNGWQRRRRHPESVYPE